MNNSSISSGQVCCPVCTLFLREGMTLQTHLYTHPIDQVIDALVRVSLNQAQTAPAPVPVASSHYTAITYQQFLSSTTSIPAVEPNLMLFNPSVVSQQFVETPASPSPLLQAPFQNVLRSSMSVMPYNYCTSNQPPTSNSTSISTSVSTSISDDNIVTNNNNDREICNINEKNNDSNKNNDDNSRVENEQIEHHNGFSVITQSCQEPPPLISDDDENDLNQPESENCRAECTEAQPEDDYCPESPKSQHNSNDSDDEIEREEERTEFVDTYVCCDNNIGTVISDSQRLIENDPNLEYDREFRAESSFSEQQLIFNQQATREETVSPVSSVSNWSSGSTLRVRKDLNDNSRHSMFNYERASADPLEISSDAFNENSHRSNSGLLNLDTPLSTRGYSVNAHLEEPKDYIENKDDNSDQSPPLNIHSDELMPPRGELSGQESLGATENSVWEMQAVREKSPEMPTSYQLLERGRWEVSVSSNNELSTAARPADKRQTVMYKCLQCDENFKCPKERRVHVAAVHQNKRTQVKKEEPLVRSLSPNKFDPLFVKEEVAGVKTEPNCKTCQDCGVELPTIKDLKKHRKEQHQDKKSNRICSTCNEYFPDSKLYKLHISKVHPLECVDCGKCFFSRPNLTLHQKRHLKVKPYHCSVCDKSFVTRQKLAEHENGHSGHSPYKCPLCDRTFKRYSNLIQHKNYYHLKLKKKLKDYFCHCGEVFHSVKKLEWHKEIHEQKPKHCIYCSEKFIHSASLTRHIRRSHDSEYLPDTKVKMENVQCPICHQVYLKTSLASHMRHIHSGEKKFSCSTCAKEFSTKWNLHLHKWTHASRTSKPFKCKLCKAAFYHVKDYQAHNRSHRNIRPYTCNHCGQQFIRKYNCIRHVREHEVSKSFSCQVCGKLFHRSYYLTEHMRVHTGVKPYSCHICAKTSSTKSNHNKHVKTHHAREPLNTEG